MYEVYQICFKIIMQCEENDYEVMKLRDDRKKEWWVSMSNEQCVTPAFSILSEPFSGLFYPSFGFPVLTRVSHVFHLNFKSILFSLLVDVLLPFPRGHTHVNPRSGCNTFLFFLPCCQLFAFPCVFDAFFTFKIYCFLLSWIACAFFQAQIHAC